MKNHSSSAISKMIHVNCARYIYTQQIYSLDIYNVSNRVSRNSQNSRSARNRCLLMDERGNFFSNPIITWRSKLYSICFTTIGVGSTYFHFSLNIALPYAILNYYLMLCLLEVLSYVWHHYSSSIFHITLSKPSLN